MMPTLKTCHGKIVLRFKFKFKLGSFVIDRTEEGETTEEENKKA
jgi:hypothetical protein